MRDSGQSLWHSCRTATAFRSSPRQNRLSFHRVNGESFLGSGCLPSTSASLTRVACAATSTNPPATSRRLCRRLLASGALFSPSPPAFAFGSGRRPSPFFRMGATRSTSRPRPFDPVRAAGGWSVARRLLQSHFIRSWSTAVESFDPRQLDIEYRCRFLRAGRCRVAWRACACLAAPTLAEAFARALDPFTGLFPPDQGPASLSRTPAESHRPEGFRSRCRHNSIATPIVMFTNTSCRRTRSESRLGAFGPGWRNSGCRAPQFPKLGLGHLARGPLLACAAHAS